MPLVDLMDCSAYHLQAALGLAMEQAQTSHAQEMQHAELPRVTIRQAGQHDITLVTREFEGRQLDIEQRGIITS